MAILAALQSLDVGNGLFKQATGGIQVECCETFGAGEDGICQRQPGFDIEVVFRGQIFELGEHGVAP
jgi:hypothetical protein